MARGKATASTDPVRITLIRHGTADDDAPSDDERALTPAGRREVGKVGRELARRRVGFDVIVASPLVRAVQTAEIVAAAVGHRGPIRIDRALLPMATVAGVRRLIARVAVRRLALVAHEPILSSVLADLSGEAARPLRKAEVVRVRMEHDGAGPASSARGRVRWRIDPAEGKLRKTP